MQRVPHPPWSARLVAVVAAIATVATACGGSESSGSDTTTPETTAAPTTPATTSATEPTVAPTTAPSTTAPATTVPDTTPVTTTPVTEPPATTVPGPSDDELARFCFDSEQVYITDVVVGAVEGAAAETRAAFELFQHSIEVAVASAPAGFESEPLAAQEAADELVDLIEQYEFDVDALLGGPDGERAVELADTINAVMEQLTRFLATVCGSVVRVLDSQGTKLAAVIADASVWPPLAVSNVAGDIRLLVPADWTDWLGSTDSADEMTFLEASPDIAQFDAGWAVPGVAASVYHVELGVADPTTRLGVTKAPDECVPIGTEPEPYADPVYTGELHLYENCGESEAAAAVLLATDEDRTVELVLEFKFPDGLDREALDRMLATFAAGA